MQLRELVDEALKALPGVAGSFFAVFRMEGPLLFKLVTFVAGCFFAYYGTPPVADYMEVGQSASGLIGMLLGFFSMAFLYKVTDWWKHFDINTLLARWLPTPPKD